MIVIDTNILAYFFFKGQHTSQAEAARHQDRSWAAPRLWRSEFRNVLAQYLRRQIITLSGAYQIMNRAETMMQDHEYDVSSLYVLDLVAESTCTAYDCEFVALARDLELPLVTTDRQMLDQFPHIAISLDVFLHRGRTSLK
jgi:predicted nucleic acid-binding protein